MAGFTQARLVALVAVGAMALAAAGIGSAATSFGELLVLGTGALGDVPLYQRSDGLGDHSPSVAGSPTGTWIVVWSSHDATGSSDLAEQEVLYSRSTDGGRTWTEPAYPYSDPELRVDATPSVATNGAGVWLIVWNGGGATYYSRSIDDGQSWMAVQGIDIGGASSCDVPHVSFAATGTAIVAWACSVPPADDYDLYYVRSVDSGATWSATAALNSEVLEPSDFRVRIAGDGIGNWVAVWGLSGSAAAARSIDDGVSWSTSQELGAGTFSGSTQPDVATDGSGTWVAVWKNDFDPEMGFHAKTYIARSTDSGANWTVGKLPLSNPANATADHSNGGRIVYGNGRWTLSWIVAYDNYGGTKGKDHDVVASDSFDAGVTWSPPHLVNSNARRDDPGECTSSKCDDTELHVALGTDGLGTTIATWISNDDLGGTKGIDYDVIYAVSRDDCPATAQPGCIATTAPGGARVLVKDGPGGKDRLRWRWKKGGETTGAHLGDPTSTSSYALCMYADVNGTQRAVFEEDLPAGTTCEGVPCWAASDGGYDYRDRDQEHGSVRSLRLVPGADGESSIALLAVGAFLGPPALPLDMTAPVRVQLLNTETGACWEASYSASVKNSFDRFKAISD